MWAGNRDGNAERTDRCAAEVRGLGAGNNQCDRPRGHGKDGLLCKQHARMEAAGKDVNIPADKPPLVSLDYEGVRVLFYVGDQPRYRPRTQDESVDAFTERLRIARDNAEVRLARLEIVLKQVVEKGAVPDRYL